MSKNCMERAKAKILRVLPELTDCRAAKQKPIASHHYPCHLQAHRKGCIIEAFKQIMLCYALCFFIECFA